MPVEADKEVDFKEISEAEALSLLKVPRAPAAARRQWRRRRCRRPPRRLQSGAGRAAPPNWLPSTACSLLHASRPPRLCASARAQPQPPRSS